MRWRKQRRSQNVDDRRGSGGMGGGGFPLPGGGKGGGVLLLVIVVGAILLGADPQTLIGILGDGSSGGLSPGYETQTTGTQGVPENDEQAQFASAVLGSTEDTWSAIFKAANQQYPAPTLVLYSGLTRSACGMGSAAAGPFYCPADQKLYIDLAFFRQLSGMGAPGDFARAYVIGHEVGHHVQNVVGTAEKVRKMQARAGESESNALSVKMELQADCYAGVWANHAHKTQNLLEEGDVDEGLAAAAAVGDDRLLKQAGRAVRPESFTHGTSQQRREWLLRGLKSGKLSDCDTFASL
ncbi:MAG: neutral zinc metallopeptidase [Chromatiales bacterium]|nr:neutral zinc metallopeptidase [Chromatiales bacterium]